jgi:hypothetical protein
VGRDNSSSLQLLQADRQYIGSTAAGRRERRLAACVQRDALGDLPVEAVDIARIPRLSTILCCGSTQAMPEAITIPTDPTWLKWMMFVDGENFTFRAQEIARQRGIALVEGSHYKRDAFVWFNGSKAKMNVFNSAPLKLHYSPIRAHYYTSAKFDGTTPDEIHDALWCLGFDAKIFKREKGKGSKGIDIALATDFLCNAFFGNYEAAVLIAGDGDYVPMVEQVKRMGKVVYTAFFAESGMNLRLARASDEFFRLDDFFCLQWSETVPSAPALNSPPDAPPTS